MDLNSIFGEINDKKDDKKRFKEYKPRSKLIPILEESILKYNDARKQDSPTLFRASGIGECTRKWAYKYSGLKDPMDVKGLVTVNVGTAYHELIQDYLKDVLVSLEERVYFSHELSGSYDGELPPSVSGGENCMLEIKTTSVDNFQRMIKHRQISNKYKMQANVYMEARGWKKVIFIFVNRNAAWTDDFKKNEPELAESESPLFLEITYEKDEKFVDKIKDEIAKRKKFMDDGVMPAYEKKLSDCDYCSFIDKCKQDRKAEKDERKEMSKLQKDKK